MSDPAHKVEHFDLEARKLQIEIELLQRPWWRQPAYLGALGPVLIALFALVAGFVSGYFNTQRAKNEARARARIEELQARHTALQDSLLALSWRTMAAQAELTSTSRPRNNKPGEHGMVPMMHATPLTKDRIEARLRDFAFQPGPASLDEAKAILRLFTPEPFSLETASFVSAIAQSGLEITVWPSTYGKSDCYGIRYGRPEPTRPYFGSNDTYVEICK